MRARGSWARYRRSTPMRDLLRGRSWASLAEADQAMIDLDGTPDKGRLGANATVGTSMALGTRPAPGCRCGNGSPGTVSRRPCRCRTSTCSTAACTPPTRWTSRSSWSPRSARRRCPRRSARAPRSTARCTSELTSRKLSTGLGDEGGFAPEVTEPEEVLRLLVQAISDAGYKPGAQGVSIALDLAASSSASQTAATAGQLLSSGDMIGRLAQITSQFPVHSIEDGLGEDDDDGWIALTARLGGTTELVGDDIFCTNPAIITAAIKRGIGNSALIKLNQIGTVTETLQAMAICRAARATGSSSPPLRRNRGPLHRRPGRRHRLRSPQDRRRPRRTRRQIQPAPEDRRHHPGLRYGMPGR